MATQSTKYEKANTLFRKREFVKASELYKEALFTAQEPVLSQIEFNLELVHKRLGLSSQALISLRGSKLIPIHQVEPIQQSSAKWKSTGDDPQFEVELQHVERLSAGFYQLNLSIKSHQKNKISQIYPDYGGGFLEDSSILLVHKRGVLTKLTRVIRFEKDVIRLRFDPLNSAGVFEIICFEIKPISSNRAIETMLEASQVLQPGVAPPTSIPKIDELYRVYHSRLNHCANNVEYEDWIRDVELPSLPSGGEAQTSLAKMTKKPLISVVVPVFNTPEKYLRACIESVIRQSYPCWELCIADDASDKPHVSEVLEEYRSQDDRIKVVYRDQNGHISRASNSALAMAKGEFVALLDHDDELPVHALYFVAQAINLNPNAQIFYSDEDKIDTQGRRFAPHFKSDWNPDLFFSKLYLPPGRI